MNTLMQSHMILFEANLLHKLGQIPMTPEYMVHVQEALSTLNLAGTIL